MMNSSIRFFLLESKTNIFKKKICTLDIEKLLKMGIAHADSNKIIQNVSVLRQTLQGSFQIYSLFRKILKFNIYIKSRSFKLQEKHSTEPFKPYPTSSQ
jgi:hypothetical protein